MVSGCDTNREKGILEGAWASPCLTPLELFLSKKGERQLSPRIGIDLDKLESLVSIKNQKIFSENDSVEIFSFYGGGYCSPQQAYFSTHVISNYNTTEESPYNYVNYITYSQRLYFYSEEGREFYKELSPEPDFDLDDGSKTYSDNSEIASYDIFSIEDEKLFFSLSPRLDIDNRRETLETRVYYTK